MAKQKVGFGDLNAFMDERKNKTEKKPRDEQSLKASAPRTATSSPAHGVDVSKNIEMGFSQRFSLSLPVSKTIVSCSYGEILPEEIEFTKLNYRLDGLLSLDDPEVRKIYESIAADGNMRQRDPILVVLNPDKEGKKYLGIWGKSRRYIIQQLREKTGEDWRLRAWIASAIPTEDIEALADSENEDRRKPSIYEKAVKLRDRIASGDFEGLTQEAMGKRIQVSAGAVNDYLKIGSIPSDWVKLLVGPSYLKYRDGLDLAKYLGSLSVKQKATYLSKLSAEAPYVDSKQLMKSIKEMAASKSTVKDEAALKIPFDKASSISGRYLPLKKRGEYKIEIVDCPEDMFERLVDHLAKFK